MLIAVEGTDGSGKGTQTRLLVEHLRSRGHRTERVEFPRYAETFFGREIGSYLNGEFGDLMSVPAKLGALLYAGDRHESAGLVNDLVAEGTVVICDRYTSSNQAHHGAKLPRGQWEGFFDWVDELEHRVLQVPRPDVTVFLDVDPRVSAGLILQKPKRDYTDLAADIHEVDQSYQLTVLDAFRQLATRPGWERVDCMEDEAIRSQEAIAADVVAAIGRHLPR